jgi:hypothetical protein
MELVHKIIGYIYEKPDVAGVYIAIASLVVGILGLFIGKAISKKNIFKQKSGDNSQNIQGEKVDIKMGDNKWK